MLVFPVTMLVLAVGTIVGGVKRRSRALRAAEADELLASAEADAASPLEWIALPWHCFWDSLDWFTFTWWVMFVLDGVPQAAPLAFAIPLAGVSLVGFLIPVIGMQMWYASNDENKVRIRRLYRGAEGAFDLFQIALVAGDKFDMGVSLRLPLSCELPYWVEFLNAFTSAIDLLIFKGRDWLSEHMGLG